MRALWLLCSLALSACHSEAAPTPTSATHVVAPPAPAHEVVHEVEGAGPAVILLHGYGAQGNDLVPFARELGGAHFYLPEAPFTRAGGGRRWFGRQSEGASTDEIDAARGGVIALIDRLEADGRPASEIILGGFSQGAMLTVEVAQHLAAEGRQLGGLMVLSGSTMPQWPEDFAVRTNVLITHGETDSVLAFAQAEELRRRLSAAGSDVEWVPFPAGHYLHPAARVAAAEFIRRSE